MYHSIMMVEKLRTSGLTCSAIAIEAYSDLYQRSTHVWADL